MPPNFEFLEDVMFLENKTLNHLIVICQTWKRVYRSSMNAVRRLVNLLNNQHCLCLQNIGVEYKQLHRLYLTLWGTAPSFPPKSPPMTTHMPANH